MSNDPIERMLSSLELEDKKISEQYSSQSTSSPSGGSIRVTGNNIAYYCEKCKVSIFSGNDRRCVKCGYVLNYRTE